MPLIVNGKVQDIVNKKLVDVPPAVDLNELLKSPDPLLVVNGKVKRIGKKSKYLLDMLTLED